MQVCKSDGVLIGIVARSVCLHSLQRGRRVGVAPSLLPCPLGGHKCVHPYTDPRCEGLQTHTLESCVVSTSASCLVSEHRLPCTTVSPLKAMSKDSENPSQWGPSDHRQKAGLPVLVCPQHRTHLPPSLPSPRILTAHTSDLCTLLGIVYP